MSRNVLPVLSLFAEYGGLLDAGRYEDWLGLFAPECRYTVMPRENHEAGLPVALIFCDSHAMLADRIQALREANKYNIHSDRHVIGVPRFRAEQSDGIEAEAPFAVYQTDQEGETRLFATGLYRFRLTGTAPALRIADAFVLLDTAAIPTLLATPV